MSSSHDMVKFATGAVRGQVSDLTQSQRLEFFAFFAKELWQHYHELKGGSLFVSWYEENFGTDLTQHSIRRNSLALGETLYPTVAEYNRRTRIIALTNDYFRLPEFKKPVGGAWNLGEEKLVVRFCLTQTGCLYLEWYKGEVVQMNNKYPTLPERVLTTSAQYFKIPEWYVWENKTPDVVAILFANAPEVLYSFCYSAVRHLHEEITARQKRADRDKALFTKLNTAGSFFGITHP